MNSYQRIVVALLSLICMKIGVTESEVEDAIILSGADNE